MPEIISETAQPAKFAPYRYDHTEIWALDYSSLGQFGLQGADNLYCSHPEQLAKEHPELVGSPQIGWGVFGHLRDSDNDPDAGGLESLCDCETYEMAEFMDSLFSTQIQGSDEQLRLDVEGTLKGYLLARLVNNLPFTARALDEAVPEFAANYVSAFHADKVQEGEELDESEIYETVQTIAFAIVAKQVPGDW